MEDELLFQLVSDNDLRRTMENPIFNDFSVFTGQEKTMFPLNLTFASLFSLTFREFLSKIKNNSVIIDRAEYPMIQTLDFKIVHQLFTRGKVIIYKGNIIGALKMATFFRINVLLNFLVDYVEQNENYIDQLDLFIFAFESNSKFLYNLATHRVADLGEVPFFSEKLPMYFSEEALKKLLSKL